MTPIYMCNTAARPSPHNRPPPIDRKNCTRKKKEGWSKKCYRSRTVVRPLIQPQFTVYESPGFNPRMKVSSVFGKFAL